MKKKRFFIPLGVAGCGKSTYYTQRISNQNVIRISPDNERLKLFNFEETGISFIQEREPEIWGIVYQKLKSALENGKEIYFDSTNRTVGRRQKLYSFIPRDQYDIVLIHFRLPLYKIFYQNQNRKKIVPKGVIKYQFKMLEPFTPTELHKIADKYVLIRPANHYEKRCVKCGRFSVIKGGILNFNCDYCDHQEFMGTF